MQHDRPNFDGTAELQNAPVLTPTTSDTPLPQDRSLRDIVPPRLWYSGARSLETIKIRKMLENVAHCFTENT